MSSQGEETLPLPPRTQDTTAIYYNFEPQIPIGARKEGLVTSCTRGGRGREREREGGREMDELF